MLFTLYGNTAPKRGSALFKRTGRLVTSLTGILLFFGAFLSPSFAAPIPNQLNANFAFGALSSDESSFVGPSSYTFNFNGQQGSAVGASGTISDTSETLSFSLDGDVDADRFRNEFEAPLTLSFENTSTESIFSIDIVPDYSGTVSATADSLFEFEFIDSSLQIRDGTQQILDLVSVSSFPGESASSSESFDLSGLTNPVSVGPGTTMSLTLSVEAVQSRQSTLLDGTASYSAEGTIGIGSVSIQQTQVPVPPTLPLLASALMLCAWSVSGFRPRALR